MPPRNSSQRSWPHSERFPRYHGDTFPGSSHAHGVGARPWLSHFTGGLVPQAVVVANPDRVAGAVAARAQGAQVLVLDDAYQLLGVGRDLNIAVVSAESAAASPWPFTGGAVARGGEVPWTGRI